MGDIRFKQDRVALGQCVRPFLTGHDLDRALGNNQVLARTRSMRLRILAMMRREVKFVKLDLALAVERKQRPGPEAAIA